MAAQVGQRRRDGAGRDGTAAGSASPPRVFPRGGLGRGRGESRTGGVGGWGEQNQVVEALREEKLAGAAPVGAERRGPARTGPARSAPRLPRALRRPYRRGAGQRGSTGRGPLRQAARGNRRWGFSGSLPPSRLWDLWAPRCLPEAPSSPAEGGPAGVETLLALHEQMVEIAAKLRISARGVIHGCRCSMYIDA